MITAEAEYTRAFLTIVLTSKTVLAALDVLSSLRLIGVDEEIYEDAIVHTASRTGFRGRWEKVSDYPWVICDIGHNEHGLCYNFAQLDAMLAWQIRRDRVRIVSVIC